MEHARCARCRNPIRGRQRSVHLDRAAMDFHVDCWTGLHTEVQADYVARVREHGLPALLSPYRRDQMASWLPEDAIDDAVEQLGDTLASGAHAVQVEHAD